jgi:hypothetical protein
MIGLRRGSSRLAAALVAAVGCAVACGCGEPEDDGTPGAALTRFLEAMDRSASNEQGLADAYALLDEADQRALSQRAAQAASVAGRDFAPWQMLVQGRFRRRFVPADRGGMQAEVRGDDATVRVTGADGRSRADVAMVKQGGRWRVKLGVAALEHAHERTDQ